MTISNDQNYKYGAYCGQKTGERVVVNGKYILIRFRTDGNIQRRGFLLLFTAVPIGKFTENLRSLTPTTKRKGKGKAILFIHGLCLKLEAYGAWI